MERLLTIGLALMPAVVRAQGPTHTCVVVETRLSDAEELRRLVASEVDRHPTHRTVTTDCGAHLKVELIEVAGERYVTGRINAEVPHRVRVEGDLGAAVTQMLRVVLHNDPVRLRGPKRRGWLRQRLHDLRRGRTMFGLETYQVGAVLNGDFESLPGLALHARRELIDWHLGIRLGAAWRADDARSLSLTGHVGAQLMVAWFWSALDDRSAYGALQVGLEYQRFEGPTDFGHRTSFSKVGFAPGVRAGYEFFRTTGMRLDRFAHGTVPAFVSVDEDNGVVDAWLPTFGVGAGVVF